MAVSVRWWARAVALAVLVAGGQAQAWNAVGHQTIGAIAQQLIAGTPAAAQVRAVLGTESLATASVWADCVKSVDEHGDFRYVSSDRYPECRPFDTPGGRRQMSDYVRRNHDRCRPTPGQESCHRQYHYADIDTAFGWYRRGAVGSSEQDVVSAILAATAVLQGRAAPLPFSIGSRQEALRLLVHWVGDLHQPLHVAAVHVDDGGRVVHYAEAVAPADFETRGGNLVSHDGRSLHAEWDEVPQDVATGSFLQGALTAARSLPRSRGPLEAWPVIWAGDSVRASAQVFDGMTFGARACAQEGRCRWPAETAPGYAARRSTMQREAVVAAGAHLAELLQAIWPN